MPAQLGVEDRLHERAQPQAVVCGDEVDRHAHDADAHELPALEQLRHRLRPEARRAVTRAPCTGSAAPAPAARRGARRPSSSVRSERWSSSWRSSVARFSARRVRTGSGNELGAQLVAFVRQQVLVVDPVAALWKREYLEVARVRDGHGRSGGELLPVHRSQDPSVRTSSLPSSPGRRRRLARPAGRS